MNITKKILVIDDDALVLKSLENLLTRNGYDVAVAKNAFEAERTLETQSPLLILCDIRMPNEDGVSFIKRVRTKNPAFAQVPVIFITGYASEEAPIEAVKLGAKDYILKPFDLGELLNSVKSHIG